MPAAGDTTGMKIGYARVSTDQQEAETQIAALLGMGIDRSRIYVDQGWSGTRRHRPALDQAMAAARAGDQFLVTRLDRLGRSVRDLHDILDDLVGRGVTVVIGQTVYEPSNPFSKLMITLLAAVAEFEADLIRERTREGMALAKKRGRLKGRQPKLNDKQTAALFGLYEAGGHTVGELGDMFGVDRATVYRAINRHKEAAG